MAGTTRWRKVSGTSMRLLRNTFGNTRESMSADAVLPASSVANTFIGVVQVLVVEQRIDCDAHGRVGDAHGAVPRVRGVDTIAHANAGRDVVGGRAEHHELAAAVVDVVVHRQHRDARRLQSDPHRMRQRRGQRAHAVEHLALGGHQDAGVAGLEIGAISFRVAGTVTRTRSGPSCVKPAAPAWPSVNKRRLFAALFETSRRASTAGRRARRP